MSKGLLHASSVNFNKKQMHYMKRCASSAINYEWQ